MKNVWTSRETRLWLVYTLLGMLADALDTVMAALGLLPPVVPKKSAFVSLHPLFSLALDPDQYDSHSPQTPTRPSTGSTSSS